MNTRTGPGAGMQRAGGIAALYVAVAYLAAIPYFVLLVDYPSATDPVSKVALLRDNFTSMYLMHVVCFQFVALAMIVVTVATYQRLKDRAPGTAQLAAAVGLIQAGLLLASVQVFNYGMDTVVRLFATAPEQAVSAWQVFEPRPALLLASRPVLSEPCRSRARIGQPSCSGRYADRQGIRGPARRRGPGGHEYTPARPADDQHILR